VEIVLARGLGQLISYQLNVAMHEKMANLMKEAELKLLQAQINPHFLFNTLNSIISLIRVNPDMARHVTMQLGTFMRLNLKIMSSQWISVRQEMSLLNAYLDIIKIRFADQFTVLCEMDPELESQMIPPAAIQLLVENSIKHGLRNKTSGGLIRIVLKRNNGRAEICIEDNGTGIPEEVLAKLGEKPVPSREGNGLGVYNINQRLISLFGNDARLFVENKAEGGCRFTFSMPCTNVEWSETVEAH
jgi:two-component system sensor histidine kinase LytS